MMDLMYYLQSCDKEIGVTTRNAISREISGLEKIMNLYSPQSDTPYTFDLAQYLGWLVEQFVTTVLAGIECGLWQMILSSRSK